MASKRVSLVHDRSEQVAEADKYTNQKTNSITVKFTNRDPDIPLQIGDWYWVVIGGDSEMYELQDVTRSTRLGIVRCEFRY